MLQFLTPLDFQARGRMSLDLGSKTRIKILAKVVKLVKLDMPKAQAKDQTNRKRLNTDLIMLQGWVWVQS